MQNETQTQDEDRATGLRHIDMENLTHRHRRSIGDTLQFDASTDLGDVAEFIDRAEENAIDARGNSGMGAGCFVEAVFGGDDPDDEDSNGEDVTSVFDPMFAHLPIGSREHIRAFITRQRNSSCYDGHNHVEAPANQSEALLERLRKACGTYY